MTLTQRITARLTRTQTRDCCTTLQRQIAALEDRVTELETELAHLRTPAHITLEAT